MKKLRLPDGNVMLSDLVAATAALAPDLHATATEKRSQGVYPDPIWTHRAKVSLREQVRKVHTSALAEMAERGEIAPRSALSGARWPRIDLSDPELRDLGRCCLTFEDARRFCATVDIELTPTTPTPTQVATVPEDTKATNGERAKVWKTRARDFASEYVKQQEERGLYPAQVAIADHVAEVLRRDGVMGGDGKPLSAATIKRQALRGLISGSRGKRGSQS